MLKRTQLGFPELFFAIALLILVTQFGMALSEYVGHAQAALSLPYPLDYGEGPILDQVLHLARADNIYRNDISHPPYTITIHPPLFQLMQVPFAQAFGPAFWYGRMISIVSTLLTALFIALTVQTLTNDWIAAIIGGLTLLAFPYILQGSVFDQVDSLALTLGWAGLFAIIRRPERLGVALAVLLFTSATYTKPAYAFVALLTALIWLLQIKRRQQAIWLIVLFVGFTISLFLLLNLVTRDGFYLGISTGIELEFGLRNLLANGIDVFFHASYLAIGCGIFMFLERMGDHTRSWALVVPYVIFATLSLVMTGKAGSSISYLLVPAAALAFAAGAIFAWADKNYWLKAVIVLALAFQVNRMVSLSHDEYAPFVMSKVAGTNAIARLDQLVREAPGPVLADEYMGLIPLHGHPLYFQPVEFSLLGATGKWDTTTLVTAIQRREFSAVFLYESSSSGPTIISRWPRAVLDAIYANYQLKTNMIDVWIYVPQPDTI